MDQEVIIIGGGVAGLSAALEFLRLGKVPTLLEAGSYPTQKVCGEFISPESLPFLKQWDINPHPILKSRFQSGKKEFSLTFPTPAGSLSHLILDPSLVQHSLSLGADIRTQVKVEAIYPKQQQGHKHLIKLSTGEMLSTSTLVIAIGRLPGFLAPLIEPQFLGIKAHFKGIELANTLEMFGFQGAYLGLSPIEEGKSNLACLASIEKVKSAGSVDQFMEKIIQENPHLNELLASGERLFDNWMTASVPYFGFKNTPDWQDSYFIGDAALAIPPACGDGLSLGITSGIMAARYASNQDFVGFKRDYKAQSSSILRAAKGLHTLLMNPKLCRMAIQGCTLSPSIGKLLFRMTRS
ncbi:MAG: NAD(P)/FAD-dependent oxidoreductase [Parachlamydiaceae bacterium]|nr:NAD(P)/FAD-dependent oxidoreductase [Parachlamydiaceae bacterium]